MQLVVQNRASNYLLHSFDLFVLQVCASPPVKRQEQQTELLKMFSLATVTFYSALHFHTCTHPEPAFGYKQTNTVLCAIFPLRSCTNVNVSSPFSFGGCLLDHSSHEHTSPHYTMITENYSSNSYAGSLVITSCQSLLFALDV